MEGSRKEKKKWSNNLVSAQCCCAKEPYKNNKRKLSVKGNLQTMSKISKRGKNIENLSIIFKVKGLILRLISDPVQ